jgi:general secretion pathway protein A
MYRRHFGLSGDPFSIAPDPRFLFMSAAHREALAHLLFGLQGGGGFVLLSGDIGTGKTTVCRAFLEQLPSIDPHCRVAYVLNPRLNVTELLQTVCEEFGVSVRGSGLKAQVDALNADLLARHAAGGRSVLIIDEAQNLSRDVLEQLRLLTNLETAERKLLQIILIGQPELRDKLAQPRLEQLAQRIVARCHLGPLSREDSTRYLAHRLAVAGHHGTLPFDRAALRTLHRQSGGVPRKLNLLADRALLGAYAAGVAQVDAAIVRRAAAEVLVPRRRPDEWRQQALALTGVAALGVAAAWAGHAWRGSSLPATPPQAAATSASAAAIAPATQLATSPTVAVAASSARTQAAAAAAASSAAPVLTASPALPAVFDEASGWQALATLWGEAAVEPCAAPATNGLRCYRSASFTLAQIRQLDRPGLVTLREENGRLRSALLLAADAQRVLLQRGQAQDSLDAADFGARWLGDYATLWRARGSPESKASAEWMAAQLQASTPGAASAAAPTAGQAVERVKAFQRAQGLAADGVPGSLTLMQLNRALGVDEPRLQR